MTGTVQQFDYSVDLLKALLWQHNSATALETLLRRKQEWYDENQRDFWQSWYTNVFNLDTANEFGLSVWSRILGVPLQVRIEGSRDKQAFGFGVNHKNFNNGNFARGQAGEQPLTQEQSRLVLKLRYFQLVSRGSVTEINEWLSSLFGDQGNVFVVDSLDMTFVTYFFSFEPGSQLRFIFEKYDLLPRPAGVGVRYQVQVRPSFGFGENHLNFNNGSFGA
ncbi:structural protein [Pseudomonas phage vB_PcuM_ KLEP17-4]|nr:structural protein [Pseudomonas phage vB_PcuM_ KLEP17-4]